MQAATASVSSCTRSCPAKPSSSRKNRVLSRLAIGTARVDGRLPTLPQTLGYSERRRATK
jgi:hypothetical protein